MNRNERKQRDKAEVDRLTQETMNKLHQRNESRKESVQNFFDGLTKEKVINYLFVFASSLLLLVGIFLIITGFNGANNLRKDIAELQEEISQKNADIENLKLTPVEQEYVQEVLNSALIDGNAVSDLQNSYKKIKDYNDLDAIKKNAETLDNYFGSKDKDGRISWYYVESQYKKDWIWEFETVYQFRGNSIPCLWLCYEKDTSNILAYVTAVYSPGESHGTFTDVSINMTNLGMAYYIGDSDHSDVSTATDTDADMSGIDGAHPDETGSDNSSNNKDAETKTIDDGDTHEDSYIIPDDDPSYSEADEGNYED